MSFLVDVSMLGGFMYLYVFMVALALEVIILILIIDSRAAMRDEPLVPHFCIPISNVSLKSR